MKFSVIIATADRPELLEKAVAAVQVALSRVEGGEIVVVDNSIEHRAEYGSRQKEDGQPRSTRSHGEGDIFHESEAEKSARFVKRFSLCLSDLCGENISPRILRSEPRNKAKALNVGIAAAQYEWLAFTDDDCLPDPDWLVEAQKYIDSSGEVFRSVVADEDESITGRAVRAERLATDSQTTIQPSREAMAGESVVCPTDSVRQQPVAPEICTEAGSLSQSRWQENQDRTSGKNSGIRVFGGRVVPGPLPDGAPCWLKPGKSGKVPRGPAIVDYAPLPASGVLDDKIQVPLGANFFANKSVFVQYGGYDEELWHRCGKAALGSEDAEIGLRFRRRGEKIGYCFESTVLHLVLKERATILNHLRWAYKIGKRENMLFPDQHISTAHTIRTVLYSLLGSLLCAIKGDLSASVFYSMRIMQGLGQYCGAVRND